ncbi:MAG: ABC transporter ATP-binding protein [Chromatiales bacterium]|nr:ABC transporter ATP-binding protein [Chromatiales bacterium]
MSDGGGVSAPLVEIESVTKRYGSTLALDSVSLNIGQGEFFALLGASGSGKTTLLRLLAGLERPESGRIRIGGQDVTDLPAHRRPVHTMFQSYALFPHLSVADNIAFGLRQRGMERAQIRTRVDEMLELVHMAEFGRRRPDQLSGGQRQRVALARALAPRPKLLLLDEPLAALDRRLREHTRFELAAIQRRLDMTFIMVTHDQDEALTLAGRVGVMAEGQLWQVAPPEEVYERPANRLVAGFVGSSNRFDGRVLAQSKGVAEIQCDGFARSVRAPVDDSVAAGSAVSVVVRPERMLVSEAEPVDLANRAHGELAEVQYLGDVSILHLDLAGGQRVLAQRTNAGVAAGGLPRRGEALWIGWHIHDGRVLTR